MEGVVVGTWGLPVMCGNPHRGAGGWEGTLNGTLMISRISGGRGEEAEEEEEVSQEAVMRTLEAEEEVSQEVVVRRLRKRKRSPRRQW